MQAACAKGPESNPVSVFTAWYGVAVLGGSFLLGCCAKKGMEMWGNRGYQEIPDNNNTRHQQDDPESQVGNQQPSGNQGGLGFTYQK